MANEQATSENIAMTDAGSTATAVADAPAPTAEQAVERANARFEADPSSVSPPPAGPVAPTVPSTPAAISPAATEPPKTADPADLQARFEHVARNAREKTTQEFREKFGWVENLDRAKVERALSLVDRLDGNAKDFHAQLGQELAGTELVDPEPDLQSTDGQHKAYSATAMRTIVTNAVTKAVRDLRTELDPTLKFTAEQRQSQERQGLINRAQQTISEIVTQARETLPWLKTATPEERQTHEKGIAAQLVAMPDEQKAKLGAAGSFYHAATAYYYATVDPALRAKAESNVLADHQKKAATSLGTVTPSGVATSNGKVPRNEDELSRHIAQKYGASLAS